LLEHDEFGAHQRQTSLHNWFTNSQDIFGEG